jgi:hypothetical protein
MATVAVSHRNILENSAVTSYPTGAAAGKPLLRAYDRSMTLPFTGPSADLTPWIKVDQGATTQYGVKNVFLRAYWPAIPTKVDIDTSANGTDWTNRLTWTPAATGYESVTAALVAEVTARHWRLMPTFATPQVLTCHELFLAPEYEFEVPPSRPSGDLENVNSAVHIRTVGGADVFYETGPPRRQRVYSLRGIPATMKTALEELNASWRGSKPFWLRDHAGAWIYVRLRGPLSISEIYHDTYDADLDLEEVF